MPCLVSTAPNILVSRTWLSFQLHERFYRKFPEKLGFTSVHCCASATAAACVLELDVQGTCLTWRRSSGLQSQWPSSPFRWQGSGTGPDEIWTVRLGS